MTLRIYTKRYLTCAMFLGGLAAASLAKPQQAILLRGE